MKNKRNIKQLPLCNERSNLKKIDTTILFSATRLFQFIDENCPLEIICIYNHFNGLKKEYLHWIWSWYPRLYTWLHINFDQMAFNYLALFSFATMFFVWTYRKGKTFLCERFNGSRGHILKVTPINTPVYCLTVVFP